MEETKNKETKKLTLRDKKKAQPGATKYFSDAEKKAIVDTVAENLTQPQQSIYFYQCQALGLNPLLNEICAIVYKTRNGPKMSIQVMRDGFLTIAHRSGKFAGMKSGVKRDKNDDLVGWAKVYHSGFKVPLYQEANFKEYDNSTRNSLWTSKPKTMIKKVAESMALRKSFNVSGVYAPEEMELEIVKAQVPGSSKPSLLTLDNGSIVKINETKTLSELSKVCREIKEKKGPKYTKAILNSYTERKEKLENEKA